MKTLKRTVSFLDADNHRATITAEITDRNGYPEFTCVADCMGHSGQCDDIIKPKTDKQKELMNLWNKYHLKNVGSMHNFDENLIGILDVIEYEEKEFQAQREKELEDKTEDEKLLSQMEEYGIDESNLDACRAYLECMGVDDLSDFEESYSGQYDSDEDFAIEQADGMGLLNNEHLWPHNCIDWEKAARELMYDYTEQDGYYFRN